LAAKELMTEQEYKTNKKNSPNLKWKFALVTVLQSNNWSDSVKKLANSEMSERVRGASERSIETQNERKIIDI